MSKPVNCVVASLSALFSSFLVFVVVVLLFYCSFTIRVLRVASKQEAGGWLLTECVLLLLLGFTVLDRAFIYGTLIPTSTPQLTLLLVLLLNLSP